MRAAPKVQRAVVQGSVVVVVVGGVGVVVDVVVVVERSCTKMSSASFVSPATRLLALLPNATKRPSAEMAAPELSPLAWVPSDATLTRAVVPVYRSWTEKSEQRPVTLNPRQTAVSAGTTSLASPAEGGEA